MIFGGLPADHRSSADETRPRNKNARPTFAGQSFGMIKTISLKRMPGLAVLKHVLRCPKQGESIPRIFEEEDGSLGISCRIDLLGLGDRAC